MTPAISVSLALSTFSTFPALSAGLSGFSGLDPNAMFELVEVAAARVEEGRPSLTLCLLVLIDAGLL